MRIARTQRVSWTYSRRTAPAVALAAAALLWACSDDTTPPAPDSVTLDVGPGGDGPGGDGPIADGLIADGPLTDAPGKDGPAADTTPKLDIGITGTDYVFDTLRLPMSASLSTAYALELGGKKYNALGDLLVAVVPTLKIKGLPQSVQDAVCSGDAINLLRVKAASFTSAPNVVADSWVGAQTACCSSSAGCLNTTNLICTGSAVTKCFSGAATFQPDSAHPAAAHLFGAISAGQLQLKPGALKLKLSLSSGGTAVLNLKGAVVKGAITSGGITSGVLAGGVPAAELGSVVLPQLAKILNNLIATVDAATKAAILAAFDTNKDGSVSAAELAGNALLSPFLAGDVDVDSDGKKEVSLGIGFSAVGATIQAP